jgi:hypothetical protein
MINQQKPRWIERPTFFRRLEGETSLARILWNLLIVVALFFVNKFGAAGNVVFCLVTTFMVVYRGENILKIFILWCFISYANEFLIDKTNILGIWKFLLIMICGIRVSYEAYKKQVMMLNMRHIYALFAFGICCMIMALINQYLVVISVLKTASFVFGVYVLLLAGKTYKSSGRALVEWVLAIAIFFVLINIMAYVTGIAEVYVRRGEEVVAPTGIPGATSHPQALGTMSALLTMFCGGIYLFTPYRPRWLVASLCVAVLVICYLSAARTGLFSAIMTLGIAIVMSMSMSPWTRKKFRVKVTPAQVVVVGILLGVLVVFLDVLQEGEIMSKAERFIVKRGEAQESAIDTVFASREALIEFSWDNFLNSPLIGIGFGISYTPGFAERAGVFSAPTEKGFLPTAILEETGVVGTFFFLFFIVTLYRYFLLSKNLLAVVMLSGALIISLGEMILFSFGGLGLLVWSMVGASLIIGRSYSLSPRIKKF